MTKPDASKSPIDNPKSAIISCLSALVAAQKKLIFPVFALDPSRICSTIAFLDGQANNDVAWPLVSLQDTILFFYK
jgi:hypothetical protein